MTYCGAQVESTKQACPEEAVKMVLIGEQWIPLCETHRKAVIEVCREVAMREAGRSRMISLDYLPREQNVPA